MLRSVVGFLAFSGVAGAVGTYTVVHQGTAQPGTAEVIVQRGAAGPNSDLYSNQVPGLPPQSGTAPTSNPTAPILTGPPGYQPAFGPGSNSSSSSSGGESIAVVSPTNGSGPRGTPRYPVPVNAREGNALHEHDWREHEWREHEWREHERREHERRERERREHARLEHERKERERREHARLEHERQQHARQEHAHQDHAPQQHAPAHASNAKK